jgi:acetyl esterase/lipase
MKRFPFALAALALALVPSAASASIVKKGIVYGNGKTETGSTPLKLDLYQPDKKSTAKRPVVVLVHGGGFVNGSRSQPDLVKIAEALVKQGDVVASIDYRLQKDKPVPSKRVKPLTDAVPKVPIFTAMVAAVDDTLSAVDYLGKQARALNIDLGRLGLIGGSAGAITVDHVAYVLDDFKIKGPKVRFVGDLWGGTFIPPAPSLEQAAKQLEKGEAPLFAVHGDADKTVPVKLDDDLVARAKAVGVKAEYHRVPGGGHGFAGTQFFTRKVTGGKTAFQRLLGFSKDYLSVG